MTSFTAVFSFPGDGKLRRFSTGLSPNLNFNRYPPVNRSTKPTHLNLLRLITLFTRIIAHVCLLQKRKYCFEYCFETKACWPKLWLSIKLSYWKLACASWNWERLSWNSVRLSTLRSILNAFPGGRGSSAVERATPGVEVPGSIPAVAARSLQVGSVSV